MYSGYEIALDGKGEWNFGNGYVKNVLVNFLVLDERDTFGINGTFGAPEKRFSINFSKPMTNKIFRKQNFA